MTPCQYLFEVSLPFFLSPFFSLSLFSFSLFSLFLLFKVSLSLSHSLFSLSFFSLSDLIVQSLTLKRSLILLVMLTLRMLAQHPCLVLRKSRKCIFQRWSDLFNCFNSQNPYCFTTNNYSPRSELRNTPNIQVKRKCYPF